MCVVVCVVVCVVICVVGCVVDVLASSIFRAIYCVVGCVVGCVVMCVVCLQTSGRFACGGLTCGCLLAAAYLADLLAAGLLAAAPHPSSTEIGTARRSGWRWRHVASACREAERQLLGAGLRRKGRQRGSCSGLVCGGQGGSEAAARGWPAEGREAGRRDFRRLGNERRRQGLPGCGGLPDAGGLHAAAGKPDAAPSEEDERRKNPPRADRTVADVPRCAASCRPYRSRRAPMCCLLPTVSVADEPRCAASCRP